MARISLSRHWKFRRLARAVGSPPLARGLLELLWDSAYEAANDYIGAPAEIADAAGWTGEPVELVAILLEAELLDERAPGEYVIHDLWDHVPAWVRLKWTRTHPGNSPPWETKVSTHLDNETAALTDQRSRTYKGREGLERRKSSAAHAAPDLLDEKDTADDLAPPPPRPNVRVLVRLGYELTERYELDADRADALKTLAARYGVPYDGPSIGRAMALLRHARAPLWIDAPQQRRRTG